MSLEVTSLWNYPEWLGILLVLIVVLPIAQFIIRRKRLNLPIIDVSSYKDGHSAIVAATLEYPNTPFVLPFKNNIVILPMSTLEEVRNLPEKQVSFDELIKRIFAGKYTGIGSGDPAVNRTVKIDLTRNIASTLDDLQEEIRYSFDRQLGACREWKKVNLYQTLVKVIALLSGRVFVGLPTSRDEEWINTTIKYAFNCEMARRAIEKWPSWLQTFVVPFLPEVRKLKESKKRGGEILEPILRKCLENLGEEKIGSRKVDDKHQGTFFSWLLKEMDNPSKVNPQELYMYQMSLGFAAIHTTTQATFHAILDMAARPHYIQPLREEIDRVIQEDGYEQDGDGFLKLKKSSMPKLRKLDSFLKETQRLSPTSLINMARITTAPLTLSTGHTLPKGTRFGFPSYAVHTSSSTPTFDPANNPSSTLPPDQFDGFRFANLRTMPGQESKHQFVTTSPDSMNFGHGNHACPGRFFASNEIKVVLIELLRSWEFRLKGDVKGVGGERPRNLESQMSIMPDMNVELEFRRRQA